MSEGLSAPGPVMTELRPGQSGETVLTHLEDGVLTVRLNRAKSAHARNQIMRDELASLPPEEAAVLAMLRARLVGSSAQTIAAH